MTLLKTTLLALLALVVASAAQAQNIDCSGGCTEMKYGLGWDLDQYEFAGNPKPWDRSDWEGTHSFTRLAANPTSPICGPENGPTAGSSTAFYGQIVIREQDDCVMDSVGDGVGCLVELPFDSPLGRSGYVAPGSDVRITPFGLLAARQAVFADFEGSIGERIIDTSSPGGTRIHWGTEVDGPLFLVRDLKEGGNCCNSTTGTLCGLFGFAEYPLLSPPANIIDKRVMTPDWVFEGGAGTAFETDGDYVVPGQQEGACFANRDRPCGTAGDVAAGGACDDVASGGAAGDTCDLSEQGIRANDVHLVTGGAPDTARCNGGAITLRGFPNENCWIDEEYAVDGDPLLGCQISNFGRHARPDMNCDGIEDDTDGDGQPGPDLCPTFSEYNPFADANGDGIGDQCQCGDANEDGAITGIDIGGMALCANDGTLCDFRISDTDDDDTITSLDIAGVVTTVNGGTPLLVCGGLNVNTFD